MPLPRNKVSNRVKAQPPKLDPKSLSKPTTTGKTQDNVIFAKDKSPDDLEILE